MQLFTHIYQLKLIPPTGYIYESSEEGHPLKVRYDNKPTNMTEKHYGIEANLPLKYNEGY